MAQRRAGLESNNVRRDRRHGARRVGGGGDMRRDEDTGVAPERMRIGQWLIAEHVQHGSAQVAAVEQLDDRLIHHVPAATAIDEHRLRRQP